MAIGITPPHVMHDLAMSRTDDSLAPTDMFEQPHAAARILCHPMLKWPASQHNQMITDLLSTLLGIDSGKIEHAFEVSPRNVQTVLRRQLSNTSPNSLKRPICRFRNERRFFEALKILSPELSLFTLARVWDEAHIRLCKNLSAIRKGRTPNHDFAQSPCIDLGPLVDGLRCGESIHNKITFEKTNDKLTPLRAVWEPVPRMSFDELPRLNNLSGMLPGEGRESNDYAGIGGGGGSDVISASLLGHLLKLHQKQMNLLVSTRTWATGSQGKEGDIIGIPRQVYGHGGQAEYQGRPVAGTFRIVEGTRAEGRDLETIPLKYHPQIYMVLDQGESTKDIPENLRANLKDQFIAVLEETERSNGKTKKQEESDEAHVRTLSRRPTETVVIVNTGGNVLVDTVNTVLSVDTGGDVFGTDGTDGTTPDQDFRVQEAISGLPPLTRSEQGETYERNLVTAVVAPGVDAPHDAPKKALEAGGMVYKPDQEERELFLRILSEYRMDGNDDKRFGKTTLALQECLRGKEGWTSINLPSHVVDTWENPWSSFVFIQKCMSDIIFMPTKALLPLISPAQGPKRSS